jgi:hypothetical protein
MGIELDDDKVNLSGSTVTIKPWGNSYEVI